MDSLISRDKAEAKKKGIYAAAAWGGMPFILLPLGNTHRFVPRDVTSKMFTGALSPSPVVR